MTEKEVQLLGFQREDMHASGYDAEYYYSYDITSGLSFLSSDNMEAEKEGQWFIEIFNTEDPVRFYKFEEVQALINTLETHLIKE